MKEAQAAPPSIK